MNDTNDLDLSLPTNPDSSLKRENIDYMMGGSSTIAEARQKNEQQQLEQLRLLNTNFVFMFGDAAAGKSAIFSSMMYYMSSSPELGSISELGLGDLERKKFTQKAIQSIARKEFLPATVTGSVSLAGGRFKPRQNAQVKKELSDISLTFMEMSGEDLSSMVIEGDHNQFPHHIDLYLGDPQLNLSFILVVSHDTISHEKDLLLSEFIHFVRDRDQRFCNQGMLLLISKWDEYKHGLSVHDFIATHMPLTYTQLSGNSSAMSYYSVGKTGKNPTGERFIITLDKDCPKRVLRWLYKTIKGDDFAPPPPPEKKWKVWLRSLGG
jgi:hypothetical protein